MREYGFVSAPPVDRTRSTEKQANSRRQGGHSNLAMDTVSIADPSHEYWSQARQPLACLVFLAPLLLIYEFGVLWFGGRDPEAIRNGADYWMRTWLHQAGFNHWLLLPGLVVAGLLLWHLFGQHPWRVSIDTLVGMFAESLIFAFFLIVVGQLQDLVFQQWQSTTILSTGGHSESARMITFIGAGVYEEVMFRLCLLPIAFSLFRLMSFGNRWSATLSILFTSLVFAMAHYVGPSADHFTLFSFTFRMLAGMFFASLFVVRGFGITVGCHAAYDLVVGALLVTQA